MTTSDRPTGPRGIFLHATETYLRAILELEEEHGCPCRRPWLRDRLGIGRASVDQYVTRLSREGLVEQMPEHRVRLTERGHRAASRVMRKHRLVERMLVDVVGLEWSLAHEEANRWQHVVGDEVERRLVGLLDGEWTSPYGNPIPALDELSPDLPATPPTPAPSVGCDVLARHGGGTAIVRELREAVQADGALLDRLHRAGLLPGVAVEVGRDTGRVVTIRATRPDRPVVEVVPAAAAGIRVIPAGED